MADHLHPTAELAPRALLPGDPGRALTLAQLLLDTPRMSNHARGLWGYTGEAADGEALTIQATGIGGASTAAVLEDLAGLAHGQDGICVAAGAADVRPDPDFAGDAVVLSQDRFDAGVPLGAPVADRTTAPFLVVARELGLRCGALLAVTSDTAGGRLEQDDLLAAEHALGHAAAALLGLPAHAEAVS